MFTLIALLFGLLCAVSTIIILVDAFQRSVIKGLLCLFCCFYYFFYALVEYRGPNKFVLVLCSFLGGGVFGLLKYLRLW